MAAVQQQISRKEFLLIQQRFIRMRSTPYWNWNLQRKSSDISQSLLCKAQNRPTQYYATRTTFRVPPSKFLQGKEERRILQWFITHKGEFLKEQSTLSNPI